MKNIPLLAPVSTPPDSRAVELITAFHFLRNNFSITTWLLVGGMLQALLVLLPIRKSLAITPVFAFLAYQLVDSALITYGYKANSYMAGVVIGKHAAIPPSAQSLDNSSPPASEEIVVLHLSARSNSPLGLLAPAFRKAGNYIAKMNADLEAHKQEYGWLGSTNWLNSGDRANSTEFMYVHYFRTYEGLHKFSHAEAHRKGWDWYNAWCKEGGTTLAFTHETYCVPKGKWETIYLNSSPSGLGTTLYPVETEGKTMYQSPIVDASRGRLRSSKGRIGTDTGDDNEKYGDEPYAAAVVI